MWAWTDFTRVSTKAKQICRHILTGSGFTCFLRQVEHAVLAGFRKDGQEVVTIAWLQGSLDLRECPIHGQTVGGHDLIGDDVTVAGAFDYGWQQVFAQSKGQGRWPRGLLAELNLDCIADAAMDQPHAHNLAGVDLFVRRGAESRKHEPIDAGPAARCRPGAGRKLIRA
jgi:hypothetical protein